MVEGWRIKNGEKKIRPGEFQRTIFTDASNWGWGASDSHNSIHGFWDDRQKEWHINFKELFAVKVALQRLAGGYQIVRSF